MKRKTHPPIKLQFAPIATLFLIVLVLTGYLGYKNHLLKTQVSPTPTPIADPTADWMIYNDLEYNFLFKYPAGFGGQGSISGPTTGKVVGLRSFTDPKTIQTGSDAHFDGFSVYVVTKLGVTNFDKYISKEITAMNAAKYTGMRNPTKIQLTNGIALVSKDEGQAYYYLPNSDQTKIVVFAYLQADASFKQTFDQVLSTFKYTQ
jgi:hypothetical protein